MTLPAASQASEGPPGLTQVAIQANEASRQANAKARQATVAVHQADEAARQAEEAAREADEAARRASVAANEANEKARQAHETALKANESALRANESAFQANAAVSQANVFGGTFQPFRLMDLPPELRCRIYECCSVHDKPLLAPRACRQQGSVSAEQPAISRTDKQVRAETLPIFYKKNAFDFHLTRTGDTKHFCKYLDEIGARNRYQMRRVKIEMLETRGTDTELDFIHSCSRLGDCGKLAVDFPVNNDWDANYSRKQLALQMGTESVYDGDAYVHITLQDFCVAMTFPLYLAKRKRPGSPEDTLSSWALLHDCSDRNYRCYFNYCSGRSIDVAAMFDVSAGMGKLRFHFLARGTAPVEAYTRG